MIKTVFKALGAAAISLSALVALPGAAQAAAGLSGSYYSFTSAPSSVANTLSLMAAAANPTATFTATTICYPSCGNISDDTVGLSAWLGSNATGLSSNVASLVNHGVNLTGYITIGTAGSHTFTIGSDDGSQLWVDGTLVANDDGSHGYATASGTISLSAGQHAIQIVQFEDGGGTGLTAQLDGSALTSSVLSTSAVPEPASWALMIGGFGVIGLALRSRRQHAIA